MPPRSEPHVDSIRDRVTGQGAVIGTYDAGR
jgi:hypothetical protein